MQILHEDYAVGIFVSATEEEITLLVNGEEKAFLIEDDIKGLVKEVQEDEEAVLVPIHLTTGKLFVDIDPKYIF